MTSPLAINIDDALADPQLLGAALGDVAPWAVWRVALRAIFGLELNREDRRTFAKIAGAREPPKRRVREAWAIVGRRAGKSRMAAAIAVAIATLVDHTGKLAAGEIGYVLVLAPTRDQAAVVLGYCKAFIEQSPILRQLLDGEPSSDEIKLKGNIVIAVHTNNFRTVRGRSLLAAIYDECAFWRDDASALPDVETYRATLPAMATTGGMLIGISSGYRRLGLLYTKHRDHFGKDDPDVLVLQGATELFNPTIDRTLIDQTRRDDPTAAAAEWDGMFRTDIAQLLDDAAIDAAIDEGRPLELPPHDGVKHLCFVDASAGRHDAFTLCIGHKEGEGDKAHFVADVVRGRRPPFDPGAVALEYAKLANEYRCFSVTGDNFAGEWVKRAFEKAGIEYKRSKLVKSALYLEVVPHFMRGAMSIPNDARLIREFRLLERRTARSGRDSVDHPRGGTDDLANAVAGCAYIAVTRKSFDSGPTTFFGPVVYGPHGRITPLYDYEKPKEKPIKWLPPERPKQLPNLKARREAYLQKLKQKSS